MLWHFWRQISWSASAQSMLELGVIGKSFHIFQFMMQLEVDIFNSRAILDIMLVILG